MPAANALQGTLLKNYLKVNSFARNVGVISLWSNVLTVDHSFNRKAKAKRAAFARPVSLV